MTKKNGFTLIELMIVITILGILVAILLMTINPTAQVSKGNDARRKKDVNRIRVAFEDYYTDKGCYPVDDQLIEVLMNPDNCNSNVFAPWMELWPCDPSGQPYMLAVEESSCPKWYKILTKLENENDGDIIEEVKSLPDFFNFGSDDRLYSSTDVNYGISSTNISWFEQSLPSYCIDNCYTMTTSCGATVGNQCSGSNCYKHYNCLAACQVMECNGN